MGVRIPLLPPNLCENVIPYADPVKQKEAQKRYYEENKEKYRIATRSRRSIFRQHIESIKSDTPCHDCGIQYPPYIMDFDHVRGEKRWNIGSQLQRASSLSDLQEEIDKCEIVCANCHRHRTHQRQLSKAR